MLLAGSLCPAAPFPPDPVDELRSELRSPLDDLRYRFPDVARNVQRPAHPNLLSSSRARTGQFLTT